MPEMKGPELRDRLRTLRPALAVVFMSGHAPNLVGTGAADEPVLKKPFTLAELASRVQAALRADRPAAR
jgi:FixJ family two-component response regulator